MIKLIGISLGVISIIMLSFSCNSIDDDRRELLQQRVLNSIRKSNEALASMADRNLLTIESLKDYYGPVRVNNTFFQKEKSLRELTNDVCIRLKEYTILKKLLPDSIKSIKNEYLTKINSLDSAPGKHFKNEFQNFNTNIIYAASIEQLAEIATNDFLILESIIAPFFEENLHVYPNGFVRSPLFFAYNKTTFNPGDTLELFMGIGSLTLEGNPEFKVNGDVFKPGPDGLAHHSMIVSKKGDHTIKINVSFSSATGTLVNDVKTLHYTVE